MAGTLAKLKRKGQRKRMALDLIKTLFGLGLIIGLIALSWTDIKHYRLPDKLTFPLMGLGLVEGFISSAVTERLLGMALGYLVFVSIEYGFKALRGKDGLGRGDAKLLAVGGAWCGWFGLPYIIVIASGLGLIAALMPFVRKSLENGRIPFGPFLSLGIFMVWAPKAYVNIVAL